jgi:hypothetical protein
MSLPPLPSIPEIQQRLGSIFPAGIANRNYVTREAAARTVYVMLYIGAVAGADRWLGPKQVYRMSDTQAALIKPAAREAYYVDSMRPGYRPYGTAWFSDNTREPIRDETVKEGFVAYGAVVLRPGVKTTSSVGRYALQASFAAMFDPALMGAKLDAAIDAWRKANLSRGALARVAILASGGTATIGAVAVRLPSGAVRTMQPGLSSIITKSLIEEFLPRYLEQGAVLWVSESGKKMVESDFKLAAKIGLHIKADKILPDTILVDLAPAEPLLVFCEAVATDGPINESRRDALLKVAMGGGYKPEQVAFVTAFEHRDHPAFKKCVASLAVGSAAWFINEPDVLMLIRERERPFVATLSALVQKS